MTNTKTYGVMHKQTGLFFAGFNSQGEPTWGPECDAKHYADESGARGQALLFLSFGVAVQRKPVLIGDMSYA